MKTKLFEGLFKKKPQVKWCKGCQQWLPISDFGNNSYFTSGKQAYCQSCMRKASRESAKRKRAQVVTNTINNNNFYNMKDLGKVVKERRIEMGMTQSDVARRANITYQTVLNMEKGKFTILHTMESVLGALNLQLVITDKNDTY
jgi:DNA-binding XRE family transcriptional regulator